LEKQDVQYASYNDSAERRELFGAQLNIPVTAPAVAKLLRAHLKEKKAGDNDSVTVVFQADAAGKDTYRIVGFTTATPVGFFADKGFAGDDLRAADLRYKGK
jgi:hypothetical protein